MVIFHSFLYVYQRVNTFLRFKNGILLFELARLDARRWDNLRQIFVKSAVRREIFLCPVRWILINSYLKLWMSLAVGTCSNQELGKPSWYYWITSMQVGFFSQQGHYPRGLRPALSSGNAVSISSTAQGGGGSFKDRKPIGEVSCCDAWMAERIQWLIERKVAEALSLSNYLSVAYLSLPFPLYLSIIHPSIHPFIYLFF